MLDLLLVVDPGGGKSVLLLLLLLLFLLLLLLLFISLLEMHHMKISNLQRNHWFSVMVRNNEAFNYTTQCDYVSRMARKSHWSHTCILPKMDHLTELRGHPIVRQTRSDTCQTIRIILIDQSCPSLFEDRWELQNMFVHCWGVLGEAAISNLVWLWNDVSMDRLQIWATKIWDLSSSVTLSDVFWLTIFNIYPGAKHRSWCFGLVFRQISCFYHVISLVPFQTWTDKLLSTTSPVSTSHHMTWGLPGLGAEQCFPAGPSGSTDAGDLRAAL